MVTSNSVSMNVPMLPKVSVGEVKVVRLLNPNK